MIKVFATTEYLLDFIDRNRTQFETDRVVLKDCVEESGLSRNDIEFNLVQDHIVNYDLYLSRKKLMVLQSRKGLLLTERMLL